MKFGVLLYTCSKYQKYEDYIQTFYESALCIFSIMYFVL